MPAPSSTIHSWLDAMTTVLSTMTKEHKAGLKKATPCKAQQDDGAVLNTRTHLSRSLSQPARNQGILPTRSPSTGPGPANVKSVHVSRVGRDDNGAGDDRSDSNDDKDGGLNDCDNENSNEDTSSDGNNEEDEDEDDSDNDVD